MSAVLGQWSPIPCTYAGGAKDVADLKTVDELTSGKVDLTFGRQASLHSTLQLFWL